MAALAQLYALYSHTARSFNQWQRALYPNFIIKSYNGKAPLPDISFRERTIFLNLEREREIPSATSLSHQVLGITPAAAPLVFKMGDLLFEFSAQNPASCPHLCSMAWLESYHVSKDWEGFPWRPTSVYFEEVTNQERALQAPMVFLVCTLILLVYSCVNTLQLQL